MRRDRCPEQVNGRLERDRRLAAFPVRITNLPILTRPLLARLDDIFAVRTSYVDAMTAAVSGADRIQAISA